MRVRIEDVAEAAGVSMKTVSRVLNNEPTVREATRERVQAAAKALNYRPDPSARRLAGRRSYLVAMLYDNPSASYVMEALEGVVETCQAHHYGMMVQPLDCTDPDLIPNVESLVSFSKLDGLILTPPLTDLPDLLDRLDELQIPYSCISPNNRRGGIGVTLQEHDAAQEMVQHLVGLGHSRIAHIKGHPRHGASDWRLAGYKSGLRRAGLRYDPALVIDGEFSFESGVAAANALLALPQRPTAIFAGNDDMAAGVMTVLHERGLSIPGDISVCGFDDTPISRQVFPALTTVHQPTREMAHEATSQLLKAIKDPASGTLVQLPYALQLRQSTGPAAQT